MKHPKCTSKIAKCFIFISLLTFLLSGCGKNDAFFHADGSPKINETYVRENPPLMLSLVNTTIPVDKTEDAKSATIDISNIANGYVSVASKSDTRIKFRVQNGDDFYNYDLNNEGKFEVFPLAMGNGTYTFTIFHNIEDTQYSIFLSKEAEVKLATEFEPFLRPSQIVNYNQSSDIVSFTYKLTEHTESKEEAAATIYYWIVNNITYDNDMAENISSYTGYLPNLDSLLVEQNGICYDYSALFAAMLRICNIPCKLIMGDVQTPKDGIIYHAWNELWLENVGWISVTLPTKANEWMRVDTTFISGNGSSIESYIANDENYVSISAH